MRSGIPGGQGRFPRNVGERSGNDQVESWELHAQLGSTSGNHAAMEAIAKCKSTLHRVQLFVQELGSRPHEHREFLHSTSCGRSWLYSFKFLELSSCGPRFLHSVHEVPATPQEELMRQKDKQFNTNDLCHWMQTAVQNSPVHTSEFELDSVIDFLSSGGNK
jgi:hypothetical protein